MRDADRRPPSADRARQRLGPAALGLPVNLWRVQNIYFKVAHEYVFGNKKLGPEWPDAFLRLGEQLSIRTYRAHSLGQPQAAA